MTVVNNQGDKQRNWTVIGLGAAALFCLCSVAVALFMFYQVGKQVAGGMESDPESASKAAHEIMDYTLPEGYREQLAMNFMIYSFVMIGPTTPEVGAPLIMVAQFQSGVDQQQMEEQLRRSFEQQSGGSGRDMVPVEVKKVTIRGDETEAAIYEGTDAGGNHMRQLITSFPGRNGTAMLLITGYVQKWDRQMVDDFLASIH